MIIAYNAKKEGCGGGGGWGGLHLLNDNRMKLACKSFTKPSHFFFIDSLQSMCLCVTVTILKHLLGML